MPTVFKCYIAIPQRLSGNKLGHFGKLKRVQPMSKKIELFKLIGAATANDILRALEAGADPNYANSITGYPPIISAIEMEDVETIKLLLRFGANINFKDELGNNLLHFAIDVEVDGKYQYGEAPTPLVSKFLLEQRLNANHKNIKGFSALDLARVYQYDAFIRLAAELDTRKWNYLFSS